MKNTFSFCAAQIVFLLILNACSITLPAVKMDLLNTGDLLFAKGDTVGALTEWNKEKSDSPQTNFEFSLRKSRAFREIGNAKQALKFAEMTVKSANALSNPKWIQTANIELGLAQIATSQFELAQLTLKNITPQKESFWLDVAQLEMGLAQLESNEQLALAHYQRAKELAEINNDKVLSASLSLIELKLLGESNPKFWAETKAKINALPDSSRQNFMRIGLARLAQNAELLELLKEAEKSSFRLHDDRLLSYALGYQGSYYEKMGNYALANQFTARAADAAQRANSLESLYLWEWQTARLHQIQNHEEPALAAYRRAVFNLQQIRAELGSNQSFREQISPLFLGLVDLLLKKAHATTDSKTSETLLHEARATLEQLKSAELQDYFQDRCVADFKEKSRGLESIAEKTAIIYPVLLSNRTELIVSFNDGTKQFIVPVGNEQVNKELHDFRYKLEKRTTFQYLKPAQQLYSWLISPLLPELKKHHIDTLVIVPDGAFRSIPFAAFYDGKQYLIENFALATTPSLTLTDPHALPKNEHLELLLNGLTKSVQGFSALPNVEKELTTIQAEFGGTILKDDNFRLSTLENMIENAVETNPYRIVHIASHGQFNRNPKKTFLLTYDSKITMDALEHYISASKYQNKPIELLTLSACQTATGDDRAALGMAGVAIKAGARSALASLWFINDQASSDLIGSFYDNLKKQPASKAQALRQAQRKLLAEPRYNHASYWSSFLLIGNWL